MQSPSPPSLGRTKIKPQTCGFFNGHFFTNRWLPSSQRRPKRKVRSRSAHQKGQKKKEKLGRQPKGWGRGETATPRSLSCARRRPGQARPGQARRDATRRRDPLQLPRRCEGSGAAPSSAAAAAAAAEAALVERGSERARRRQRREGGGCWCLAPVEGVIPAAALPVGILF